ncbi:hypothetical protein SCHPADRAFT_956682 [Schizopora paradoxa]|uniref:choline-phosphate cytidylyltransferase n=1 Tax=Schizopora paradoxa TaxID=27342 RepID=A0A0H2S7U6_9AGAM|nr:hypothetical protein SCHPADRAFT_956682 [Schizopora paradoxa]
MRCRLCRCCRSEEDNDFTDDGSIVSIPSIRNQHMPSSPLIQARSHPSSSTNSVGGGGAITSGGRLAASSRSRHNHLADVVSSDDGVDSPTYDGDIESTTSTASRPGTHHFLGASRGAANSSTSTLTSPTSSTFPSNVAAAAATHGTTTAPTVMTGQQKPVNAAAVPLRVPDEPEPAHAALAEFDPAKLTPEDIRAFVQKAITGDIARAYKINEPPVGRPIRIYADGVYDLFHFGHALQLRQAKMAFPSVYLLVGVCSDELVLEHKARTVMNHAERCEAVRHCRWVDEVVEEAPWVIDADFVDKWEIDYVAHDEDPYAASGHDDVYAYVKSQGKFIPTRRTPGVSTSELLERIVTGYRKKEFDGKLEKMGHSELKAEGSDFDDSPTGSRTQSRVRGRKGGSVLRPNSL